MLGVVMGIVAWMVILGYKIEIVNGNVRIYRDNQND